MNKKSSLQEFFRNKNIFLTGGTGFFGKIFLEKILRCNPGKCYLLTRPKKGENSFDRVNSFFKSSLAFQTLRKEKGRDYENFVKKHIQIVEGDIAKDNLGMSQGDYKELMKNTNLVINAGASVSWKETISEMIKSNFNSASYALDIAKKSNSAHFVHISTMAVNNTYSTLFEKGKFDYEDYIQKVEKMDANQIMEETKVIHEKFGSTYAFVKAMCDKMIQDKRNGISTTILKSPSLGPAFYDPAPGWLDNITGYTGNYFYIGKGRSLAYLINRSNKIFELPIDIFANITLNATNIFGDTNQFNYLNILPESDITTYEAMIHALNYFKSHPVRNVKLIDPKFFECREEMNAYLNDLEKSNQNNPEMLKLIERTRYFNTLYLQANYFKSEAGLIKSDINKLIQLCPSENMQEFPMKIDNFESKKYVELSCEGIKKYIIKAKD